MTAGAEAEEEIGQEFAFCAALPLTEQIRPWCDRIGGQLAAEICGQCE